MLDILIQNSVSAIFTLVVGYLSYQISKMNKARELEAKERAEQKAKELADIELLKVAVKYILKNDLKKEITEWSEMSYCPIEVKEELFKEIDIYHQLGGNGALSYYIDILKELPTKE